MVVDTGRDPGRALDDLVEVAGRIGASVELALVAIVTIGVVSVESIVRALEWTPSVTAPVTIAIAISGIN